METFASLVIEVGSSFLLVPELRNFQTWMILNNISCSTLYHVAWHNDIDSFEVSSKYMNLLEPKNQQVKKLE